MKDRHSTCEIPLHPTRDPIPAHFATMEALAGYGSDSSSDDSSGPASGASGRPSGGAVGGGGALAGLLPSDASSSEDERVVPETKTPPAVPTTSAASATPGGSTAPEPAATSIGGAEGSASSPMKKRPRWDSGGDGKNNDATVTTCPLPPPKLSAAGDDGGGGEQVPPNAFEELIRFDKDYTVQLRANLTAAAAAQAGGGSDKTNAKVSQQLNALHKTFYGATATASGTTDDESGRPTSFASHLRHQHEFGNPNLFPNVVEQFGIAAGGSNLPNKLWKASCEFRDFESCDRLMAAEEQARFRAANSSNPSG